MSRQTTMSPSNMSCCPGCGSYIEMEEYRGVLICTKCQYATSPQEYAEFNDSWREYEEVSHEG